MYVNLKYILTCICVYKVIILSPKCKFSNITYCQFYAVYLLCVLEIEKLCFNILQETGNRDLSYPIILRQEESPLSKMACFFVILFPAVLHSKTKRNV